MAKPECISPQIDRQLHRRPAPQHHEDLLELAEIDGGTDDGDLRQLARREPPRPVSVGVARHVHPPVGIEAEDILLDAGLDGVTVLRVAGIYGPGRDPRPRFAQPALLPMRGEYWVNLAHQADIVAAIAASLAHCGPPRVLNVSDGAPATAAEIARWCAAAQGLDPESLDFSGEGAPARSNQRVSNAALVATGWRARLPGSAKPPNRPWNGPWKN